MGGNNISSLRRAASYLERTVMIALPGARGLAPNFMSDVLIRIHKPRYCVLMYTMGLTGVVVLQIPKTEDRNPERRVADRERLGRSRHRREMEP